MPAGIQTAPRMSVADTAQHTQQAPVGSSQASRPSAFSAALPALFEMQAQLEQTSGVNGFSAFRSLQGMQAICKQ